MDLCQQSYERFVLGTTDDHAHSLYGRVEASKLMMRTAFYSRNKRCNANTQNKKKTKKKERVLAQCKRLQNTNDSYLSLIVALRRLLGLLLEPLSLNHGVIQLGVGIANLSLGHEQLESLGQAGDRAVSLGKRRHDFGVIGDKGGVNTGLFQEMSNQLVNQSGDSAGRPALHIVLLAQRFQELAGLGSFHRRELATRGLLKSLNHTNTPPWWGEVNHHRLSTFLGGIWDNIATGNLEHHLGEQLLSHLHEHIK
jgi:hypothetical protein